MQDSDYKTWTESGKDEERIRKVNSINKVHLDTSLLLFILFHFTVSICHNFSYELPPCGNINKLPNNKIRQWFVLSTVSTTTYLMRKIFANKCYQKQNKFLTSQQNRLLNMPVKPSGVNKNTARG